MYATGLIGTEPTVNETCPLDADDTIMLSLPTKADVPSASLVCEPDIPRANEPVPVTLKSPMILVELKLVEPELANGIH